MQPPRLIITAIFALCMACTAIAVNMDSFSRRSACRIIDRYGSDPICGIWQMGGDGATFAVIPRQGSSAVFDIVLVDSPDMSVLPGLIMGKAASTGKPGHYDAEFDSSTGPVKRNRRCIIVLDNEGGLTFNSYKKGKNISLWRWLPYLYRVTITDRNTRPANADGAVRIYPPITPSTPAML